MNCSDQKLLVLDNSDHLLQTKCTQKKKNNNNNNEDKKQHGRKFAVVLH